MSPPGERDPEDCQPLQVLLRYAIFSVLLHEWVLTYLRPSRLCKLCKTLSLVSLAFRLIPLVCLSSLLVAGSYCSLCGRLFLISLRSCLHLLSSALLRATTPCGFVDRTIYNSCITVNRIALPAQRVEEGRLFLKYYASE